MSHQMSDASFTEDPIDDSLSATLLGVGGSHAAFPFLQQQPP